MERMFLIGEEELTELLMAWHDMNFGILYGMDNWSGWEMIDEYKQEWCRENGVEYTEDFSLRDIARYELKNYDETELAWES